MGNVAFEALEDPPRLRAADTVGNEQYTLYLDSPVDPEPVPADGFAYPVSDAVRVEMEGFEIDGIVRMHLWNLDSELLHETEQGGELEVPRDDYYLELCTSVKSYLRFNAALRIDSRGGSVSVHFDSPSTVEIGARSPREQPAHTITTTRSPRDVAQAFSHLSEGLLTTTPSRAFPNLRGHPPKIEIGDELAIPEDIDTGPQPVGIVLPPDLEYLFEAAPLVYYLNAEVRTGPEPRLVVDGETVFEIEPDSFTASVEDLLRHVLVLDCVVRSVGSYPVESAECGQLLDYIPYDLEELYGLDEGARLKRYLEVPFEPVVERAPRWPAIGYVEPLDENVGVVPHLVVQLVPIRIVSPKRFSGAEARQTALAAFTGGDSASRGASDVFSGNASFVNVASTSETTTIWAGNDIPISSNKLVQQGFQNRYQRTGKNTDSIDVTIVCNEAWMSGEATTVADHYTEREDLPFDVTTYEHLDRESLARVLEEETDFLHFVGHAKSDGLECEDGYLDVATTSSVGVETFFINACQSYQQAKRLVEGGAIGGIATLSDITDDQASVVGRTAAKLLDLGYPLRVALEIARSRSVVGGQYLVVGDGGVTLVPADAPPSECSVKSTDSGYELEINSYQSMRAGVGALFIPGLESESEVYLVGRSVGPYQLSAAELGEFLELENVPVQYDGEFRWAFDLAEELT